MRSSRILALVIAGAGLLISAAPAPAKLQRCLPSPKCKGAACCKFPHECLYKLDTALTDLQTEFFGSDANRQTAHQKAVDSHQGLVDYTAGIMLNQMEDAWLANGAIQDAWKRSKQKSCPGETLDTPAVSWRTDDDCHIHATGKKTNANGDLVEYDKPDLGMKYTPQELASLFDKAENDPGSLTPAQQKDLDSDVFKQDTCVEFVIAELYHEQEHQDRCQAKRMGLMSDRATLEDFADDERNAHARQAKWLRMQRKDAKRSCKKVIDDQKRAAAKQRMSAFNAANAGAGGADQ